MEPRYADDHPERVAPLAEELVHLPVDILVTQGTATWTVVGFESAVPVVFIFSADPVEAGFAPSLAPPGGNATGLPLMSLELNRQRPAPPPASLPSPRPPANLPHPPPPRPPR